MEKPNKLNLDELYEYKKLTTKNTMISYNKILDRVHNKIKQTSRQKINNECCWFIVPEIILGIPKYNVADCIAYIMYELKENGFAVSYTHPNLLFITWNHWIPDYVRNEYKKQTGIAIDGYGNELIKKETPLSTPSKPNKPSYKSIDSYVPSGKMVYDDDLLKTIELKTS
jgi:hypothetical protein